MKTKQMLIRFDEKNPKSLKGLITKRTNHIHTNTIVMDLVESAMLKIGSGKRKDLDIKERAAIGALVKSRHVQLPNPLFSDNRGDTFKTPEQSVYYKILGDLKTKKREDLERNVHTNGFLG